MAKHFRYLVSQFYFSFTSMRNAKPQISDKSDNKFYSATVVSSITNFSVNYLLPENLISAKSTFLSLTISKESPNSFLQLLDITRFIFLSVKVKSHFCT